MAIITDQELISKLLQATTDRRIQWEKSGMQDRFAAKFADKWTLTIAKLENRDDFYHWLTLSDAEGEEILRITSSQEPGVDELFELASRCALRVDEALTDVLKEIGADTQDQIEDQIKDEDIPF